MSKPMKNSIQNKNTFRKKHTLRAHSLAEATGPIDYNMTNDYMFRATLQTNRKVLTGLICSLLHLNPADIKSIEITNPIELGKAIDEKTFVLDIRLLLNSNTLINLEMQVQAQLYWPDRSLAYLCRSFDQLYSGDEYGNAKPAIHIGFLCFTPFEEYREFYATYKLLNVKNYHVYSDKFDLRVVDLTHIDLATKEDKQYQIDYWASLFMAKTWEDLKMIAKNNEFMQAATETIFELNGDQTIRDQCLARQDYYRTQNTYKKMFEEQAQKIQDLSEQIKNKDDALAEKDNALAEKNDALAKKDNTIAMLMKEIAALKKQ